MVRDLRVFAQAMDADVFHYHDNMGLEADAVVQCRDGRWGAFEVKLGLSDIDDGANSLLRMADRIDIRRHGAPGDGTAPRRSSPSLPAGATPAAAPMAFS